MSRTLISPFYQFCLLLVLSLGLLILDNKTELFQPVKTIGTIIRQPFELIVRIQSRIPMVAELAQEKSTLQEQITNLEQENMTLRVQIHQYEAIKEENERLARLLATSIKKRGELLLANIVVKKDDPYNHQVIIDQGFEAGVYVGQPAVSDAGVIGQITEVGFQRSVVMLLSHVSQGLPVEVVRNGLLTIGVGTGIPGQIRLPYLELEADIRVGDSLITSGMGDRFVAGYPVGTVIEVLKDTTRPFLQVSVETAVNVRYNKNVLLLWTSEPDQSQQLEQDESFRGER
ncbi:MAG: rod shape-determining protein MreC [Gammaproteobacteria bacterium]|nr:rod shape-determining protein MreC [Gammaproteobacteria bacterium]MCY4273906.1 rod shape-determining protein MreC [Gammaproteobacteria bacterium]